MIRIQNVSKRYGKVEALKDINLTIPEGVCYGIVGANGAGKSSLIKILAGIIKDHDGDVKVSDDAKQSLGYVPQDICLEETLSAASNLNFYGKIYGLSGQKLSRRAKEVFADIGLTDRTKSKVKTFSGGMKRRLNIGCALMHEPQIVIMDEPTVGVDPQSKRHIFQLIRKLKKEGKTILYVSHYMEEIEAVCDYVAFIDGGRIVEQGGVSDLLTRYAQPAVFIKGDIPEEWLSSEKSTQQENGGWLLHTENPLETLANLSTRCADQNIIPSQLSLMHPRLEDIFFSLTGTALRDHAS